MGKHCVHSLLASSQGRGKKTQAKVCVKCASESQKERKKIACVILKKLLLGQFLLAVPAASPLESHKASLGPFLPHFQTQKEATFRQIPSSAEKENKRKLRVLVSEEPQLVFE